MVGQARRRRVGSRTKYVTVGGSATQRQLTGRGYALLCQPARATALHHHMISHRLCRRHVQGSAVRRAIKGAIVVPHGSKSDDGPSRPDAFVGQPCGYSCVGGLADSHNVDEAGQHTLVSGNPPPRASVLFQVRLTSLARKSMCFSQPLPSCQRE